jgi:hypothetical protein
MGTPEQHTACRNDREVVRQLRLCAYGGDLRRPGEPLIQSSSRTRLAWQGGSAPNSYEAREEVDQ